jgi:lysyl-tRNA synthetase class 2
MDIKVAFESMEGSMVSVARRIMSKRGIGKAIFCDGRRRRPHPAYVRIDELGAGTVLSVKKYDFGDIVGVKGEVFRTHRGEISVRARRGPLSKSLLPLPRSLMG